MPTPTPRIGYPAPLLSDPYDTGVESDRWFLADQYPGVFICTSGTRPSTWDATHEGMLIFETDSALLWRWDGAAFVRQHPLGHLDTDRRTTDLTVASGSYTTVAQATADVPEGGRDISISCSWCDMSGGAAMMAIYRDATLLVEWKAVVGVGGTFTFTDLAPSSGSTDYIFKVKNSSTTTTVECSATSAASISVVEV